MLIRHGSFCQSVVKLFWSASALAGGTRASSGQGGSWGRAEMFRVIGFLARARPWFLLASIVLLGIWAWMGHVAHGKTITHRSEMRVSPVSRVITLDGG